MTTFISFSQFRAFQFSHSDIPSTTPLPGFWVFPKKIPNQMAPLQMYGFQLQPTLQHASVIPYFTLSSPHILQPLSLLSAGNLTSCSTRKRKSCEAQSPLPHHWPTAHSTPSSERRAWGRSGPLPAFEDVSIFKFGVEEIMYKHCGLFVNFKYSIYIIQKSKCT